MQFSETAHKYIHNGKVYQSVTQYIKQWEVPFNKELIAEKTALKNNRDTQDVLDEWETVGEIAVDYGNSIHKGIECWVKYGRLPSTTHIAFAVEQWAELFDRTEFISELCVYDEDRLLAGTIDLLKRNGREIEIHDIKTNGDLHKAQKFIEPYAYLKDKLGEYRLQLTEYKKMIEKLGFTVTKLIIHHWDGEKWNLVPIEEALPKKITIII